MVFKYCVMTSSLTVFMLFNFAPSASAMYDPMLGRLASRDPIGFEGGFSGYGYVNAMPLTSLDPDGEKAHKPPSHRVGCRAVLYATIASWRRLGYDCAADLLASALSKKPNPCPNSCRDAIRKEQFDFVMHCLEPRMHFRPSCGATTRHDFELRGAHRNMGDDLHWGFGWFLWTAKGTCQTTCAPEGAGSCCCKCSGICGFDLTTGPDKFDFSDKGKLYPHPLWCAKYMSDIGELRDFKTSCKLTAQGITMKNFTRCPGPSVSDDYVEEGSPPGGNCTRTKGDSPVPYTTYPAGGSY